MQAEKEYTGTISLLFLLYFKGCVMITNVWILVFSVIYLGIYQVGAPVFEKFCSLSLSFSFYSIIFFFFFFFFFCLSFGGPFSSGAPGHCPPMPPSRYATGSVAVATASWNTFEGTLRVLCSYSARSYRTCSSCKVPTKVLQLAASTAVLRYMGPT